MKKIITALILLFSLTTFAQVELSQNNHPDIKHLTHRLVDDALELETNRGISKVEFINKNQGNVFKFYTRGANVVNIQNISTFPRGYYTVSVYVEEQLILLTLNINGKRKTIFFLPYDNTHATEFYPSYSRDTIYIKETREQFLQRVK